MPNAADPGQGYHTYTVDWTPGCIAWSIDGKPVKNSGCCSSACTKSVKSIPWEPMSARVILRPTAVVSAPYRAFEMDIVSIRLHIKRKKSSDNL